MKRIIVGVSFFTAGLAFAVPVNAQSQGHGMDHGTMDHGANAATAAGRPS